ncbi:DUF2637 domain-containing protein [Streptomyces sp. NPDC093509]|uniref:DUF2637 domain-containing protein n=1 Tax=Streptomyces sp. NPDC093509 TaxID=3154982 RepID=UPI00344B4E18
MYDRHGMIDPYRDSSYEHLYTTEARTPAGHPETLVNMQDLFSPVQEAFPPPASSGPLDPFAFDHTVSLDDELANVLRSAAEQPQTIQSAVPHPRPGSHDHRKPRARRVQPPQGRSWLRMASISLAALTALTVAMVSVFGAVVSYDPVRHVATPTVAEDLSHCWPLLVFGPWFVASLSVLRAALHRRRAAHSWAVVVLFSALAVTLCINQADKTLTGMAVGGLPPITALTCFHQLVRQITLTRPHRRPPRSRPRRSRR